MTTLYSITCMCMHMYLYIYIHVHIDVYIQCTFVLYLYTQSQNTQDKQKQDWQLPLDTTDSQVPRVLVEMNRPDSPEKAEAWINKWIEDDLILKQYMELHIFCYSGEHCNHWLKSPVLFIYSSSSSSWLLQIKTTTEDRCLKASSSSACNSGLTKLQWTKNPKL